MHGAVFVHSATCAVGDDTACALVLVHMAPEGHINIILPGTYSKFRIQAQHKSSISGIKLEERFKS
jgi:hypothetical protein